MPEILLPSASSDARSALNQCDSTEALLYGRDCRSATSVRAYNPYFVGKEPSLNDQTIVGTLMAGDAPRKLTELNQCFGPDQVNNLAEFREHGASLGIGSIGTTASVYTDRTNDFVKALERYQGALLSYRDAARSHSPLKGPKYIEARRAFEHLQANFQSEMKILASRSSSRRGTPLTQSERALTRISHRLPTRLAEGSTYRHTGSAQGLTA